MESCNVVFSEFGECPQNDSIGANPLGQMECKSASGDAQMRSMFQSFQTKVALVQGKRTQFLESSRLNSNTSKSATLTTATEHSLRNKDILVVDDNSFNVISLVNMLEVVGINQ